MNPTYSDIQIAVAKLNRELPNTEAPKQAFVHSEVDSKGKVKLTIYYMDYEQVLALLPAIKKVLEKS